MLSPILNSCIESPATVLVDTIDDEAVKHSLPLHRKNKKDASYHAWEFPVLTEEEKSNHLVKSAMEALDGACKERSQTKAAEAWNALGLIRLFTWHDPEGALECHKTSLFLHDDPLKQAITLNDIGMCYERTRQCKNAMQSYRHALDLLEDQVIESKHLHVCKESLERTLARLLRL